ncbi:MAG TPA: hypothetical protein VN922_18280 [Bacteroidia bacterium]|nr:hypothetical protein [Bacteroidia bacterium]
MVSSLILLINIATVIAMFVTSTGKIIDRRRAWYNILTKRGWIFLVCSFVLVLIPLLQNNYLQSQAKIEQDERDKKMLDSYNLSIKALKASSDSNSNDVIKTLAEYGLKYDKAQKRIEKLVTDSSKRTYIQPENPTLKLINGGSSNQSGIVANKEIRGEYNFYFTSIAATSSNINFKISFLIYDGKVIRYLYGQDLFNHKKIISKGETQSKTYEIDTSYKYDILIPYIRGTYTNDEGSKKFTFDEVFYYNNKTERFSMIEDKIRTQVIELVNTNEKK